jgi:hypothetical protein
MHAGIALPTPSKWRDRFGRVLMWILCVGAVGAFVSGIGVVRAAGPETIWVETWRACGYLVFAGMFALLAARPRAAAGVWELAFAHKFAMAVSALFLAGAAEAGTAGAVDAFLALALALAYVSTRGWLGWRVRS